MDRDDFLFNFRYSLLAGTSHFKINKYDGRITVAQSFENISSTSIVLTVIASDQGRLNFLFL